MADSIVEVIKAEQTTLSRVIWRLFRRKPRGYEGVVLTANPGIARHKPFLPVGLAVVFPAIDEIEEPDSVNEVEVVRMWN